VACKTLALKRHFVALQLRGVIYSILDDAIRVYAFAHTV